MDCHYCCCLRNNCSHWSCVLAWCQNLVGSFPRETRLSYLLVVLLRQIQGIWRSLGTESAKTLVHAFVTSRVNSRNTVAVVRHWQAAECAERCCTSIHWKHESSTVVRPVCFTRSCTGWTFLSGWITSSQSLGHFAVAVWISYLLRLSPSPKFRMRLKISQKVKSFSLRHSLRPNFGLSDCWIQS